MSADKQSYKQIYLTELTPVSTKRRRTEEITFSLNFKLKTFN